MSEEKKKTVSKEELEERAGIEAAADHAAEMGEKDINERLPYVIKLSRPYMLEGKEMTEVDLSGLEDLTTAYAEYLDRVMQKMNYHPKDKFRDITYTKHIAMRVTNLPIEFFNTLKWKDQQAITSRITIYFLF